MGRKIADILAVLPGALLLYTAFAKWMDFPSTHLKLRSSPVAFVSNWAKEITWVLPAVEIGIVCLMISGVWRRAGVLLSGILFLLFSGYLILLLTAVPGTVCGCGGFINHLSLHQHLMLTIAMAILSLLSWRFGTTDTASKIFFARKNGGSRKPATE